MKSRLLLNVIVIECTAVLELFSSKNQSLLVRRNAAYKTSAVSLWSGLRRLADNVPFLVLNLGFDIVNGVGRLHLEGDGLPREGLDEDLHLQELSA